MRGGPSGSEPAPVRSELELEAAAEVEDAVARLGGRQVAGGETDLGPQPQPVEEEVVGASAGSHGRAQAVGRTVREREGQPGAALDEGHDGDGRRELQLHARQRFEDSARRLYAGRAA